MCCSCYLYNSRGGGRCKWIKRGNIGWNGETDSRSTDVGHILENVVYLELLRRGYDVFVGKVDELEVDFVAMEPKKTIYYQVAASVRDETTLKRELTPLQKITDHYPKIILTLDEDPEADYEGIRRINVLDWLIGTIE